MEVKDLVEHKKTAIHRPVYAILFLIVAVTSCTQSKTYKYIEITEEDGLLGGVEKKEKEPRTIEASSDSAAYLDAFQYFTISMKVNNDMREAMGTMYSRPIEFRLFNNLGEDIAKSVFFLNKDSLEQQILQRVNSKRNTIKESIDKSKEEEIDFRKKAKIDSAKIKSLKQYFRLRKDEFSNDNKTWYEPKSAPQYTNRNGIYCYFQTENGLPSNLRLRFQYYSDEWLFFSRIQFAIDGKAFEYIPLRTETDSGDGGKIWEWSDEALSVSDKELIYALANAKSAKMKIIGRQYFDQKTISHDQIINIGRTLELYNALGATY